MTFMCHDPVKERQGLGLQAYTLSLSFMGMLYILYIVIDERSMDVKAPVVMDPWQSIGIH